MTRYVILGAGAVGGTVGGRLHEAGRDVVLVARGAHLEALRHTGLRLDEPGRSRTLRIPAAGSPGEVDWRPGDVAVLATKTQHTADLLDALRAVAPDVPVACAQNGVANERFAAARFAHVLAVCVIVPAEHLEPGRVVAYSTPIPGALDIGRYPGDGGSTGPDPLADAMSVDFAAAGFGSRSDPAIMAWKYRKLLSNLGNAVEAACGADPDGPALRDAAQVEGERCLVAAGIAFVSAAQDRDRRLEVLAERPVDGRWRYGGSTWQSLLRGAGSVEVAYLNGEIVTLGRRHGVPTPVNAAVLAAVEEMAAAGERPGTRRAAALMPARA